MKENPMQWSHTTPTLSRLDYIATAIYAAYISNYHNIDEAMSYRNAVSEAKALIAELDKEQSRED